MTKIKDPIEHENAYLEHLRKKLNSPNFKANVSVSEFVHTQFKYSKAKLRLKMLLEDQRRKR